MKIESRLAINNIKRNIRRTFYTIVSLSLCIFLIFTTMFVVYSIRNGIDGITNNEYSDYHVKIKNVTIDNFNKIKELDYIDTIYVQSNQDNSLHKIDEIDDSFFDSLDTFNIFIKFKNIKKACVNLNDLIETLNFSFDFASNNIEVNQTLLTVYGLIDINVMPGSSPVTFRPTVNVSYIIDILIVLVLVVFSILFIVILYNAFLVTINERRKEYAVLNSIGATENQILKMTFIEATIIGIIGIIIGFILSIFGSNFILKLLNNILASTEYNFKLVFSIKYFILLIILIFYNIYLSSIIPSVKASGMSVIRNSEKTKYKKSVSVFGVLFPIEGRLALKNLKRNKSKYRIIVILFVVCMVSFIAISTYIEYEKEVANLAIDFDIDANIHFSSDSNIDYKTLLANYEKESGKNVDYIEYKYVLGNLVIYPQEAILKDVNNFAFKYDETKLYVPMMLVGLDNENYNKYIKELNGNNGDFIVYNNGTNSYGSNNIVYEFSKVFDENYYINKMDLIRLDFTSDSENFSYNVVDDKVLTGNFIYIDDYLKGFKETKYVYGYPTVFMSMDKFNIIEKSYNEYVKEYEPYGEKLSGFEVKIKCDDVINFKNYIDRIENEQNINLSIYYYTLDNYETIIYINILQLILKVILITIIVIGIVDSINVLNASFSERKQEFKILNSIGCTRKNINKILIYECIFIFLKALIISYIISIPIIFLIINYMKNIIVLDKIMIPFGKIVLFYIGLFIISLLVTLYSSKFIKNK